MFYVIFMLSIVTTSLPPFLFLSVVMFKHSFKDKKQKKLRKKQKTIGASFRNMYVFLSLSPHIPRSLEDEVAISPATACKFVCVCVHKIIFFILFSSVYVSTWQHWGISLGNYMKLHPLQNQSKIVATGASAAVINQLTPSTQSDRKKCNGN